MLIKQVFTDINQKLDSMSSFSSCTSSASSISIDYESKSTYELNPPPASNFKCPFNIDSIPHYSQVKPKDYNNYFAYVSPDSSISESESIINPLCSSPIQSTQSLGNDENNLIEQSNKKLDALIQLIQDIHKVKNANKCKFDKRSPVSSLNSSTTTSSDEMVSIYSEQSVERSHMVQLTAYSLAQRRADLLINDIKIRESLNRLKQRIKDCKEQAFSTRPIRKERNDHLILSCQNSEHREEIFEEEYEAPLRISISLNQTEVDEDQDKEEEEVAELLTNKMPYDYDFADFMAFKKQQEAELALSKKIRFIYGTDKSLDEISLNSSLKGTKAKCHNRSSSNNRVTFNDTIEFYDPALQNRANYSLKEFAMLKANPNLVIKNTSNTNPTTNNSPIRWSDPLSYNIRPSNRIHDQVIPIEVEKIEKDSRTPDNVVSRAPGSNSDFLLSGHQPRKEQFNTIYSKINNGLNSDFKYSESIRQNNRNQNEKFDLNNHYDTINEQQQKKYSIDSLAPSSASLLSVGSKISPHYSVPKKITKLSDIEKKIIDTERKYEPRAPTPLPQDKYDSFDADSYSHIPSMVKSSSAGDFRNYQPSTLNLGTSKSFLNNDYEDIKFQSSLTDFKVETPSARNDPAPFQQQQQQQPTTPRRSIVEIKRKESEFRGPYSESLTNLSSPSSSSVAYTISNSPLKSQQFQSQYRPRGIVKIKNNTNLSKLSGSNSSLPDNGKHTPLKSMQFKTPVERIRSETPPAPQLRPKTPPQPQVEPARPMPAYRTQVAPQITVTPPPTPRERIKSIESVESLTIEPESSIGRQIPIEIVNQPEPTRVVLKKIETAQNHMNSGNFNLVTVTDKELSGDELKQVEQEIAEAERSANYLSKSKVFNQSNYETDYLIGQPEYQRAQRSVYHQRRSSKIGEAQNERELNSIFRRIYNRHRFSLVGNEETQQQSKSRSKSPGIRRTSNNTNLSNF